MAEEQRQLKWCDCGLLAEHQIREDNRLPRFICGGCLSRLQYQMQFGERDRLEALAAAARRKRRKAERGARRSSRRR